MICSPRLLRRVGVFFVLIGGVLPGGLARGGVFDGYEVRRLGLIGPGYQNTSTDAEAATAAAINPAGQVIGTSFRYDGSATVGLAAWIDDGTGPVQLGFTGAGYEKSDGEQWSEPIATNAVGQVIGTSDRYSGSAGLGKTAWLYDDATLIPLGFTGTGFQKSDGTQVSSPEFINDAGHVVGLSNRFSGSSWLGRATWLDDGATTTPLGLTGGEFRKNSTGWEYSDVNALNAVGQAIGISERFNSFNNNAGQAAWIADAAGTRRLGLLGTGYHRTGTTDEEFSDAQFLNDAGQAAGFSKRYDANAWRGYAAWIDDGTTTHQVGLTGTGYQKTDGYEESKADGINAAGQVIGYSERYNANTHIGDAAWIADANTTRRLGFTAAGFNRASDGKEDSSALALNDAGEVIGHSRRYDGSTNAGQAAWLDDGTALHELGFTTADYQRNDGYTFSKATALNDAGQAVGYSKRYDGSSSRGQAGWFFDPLTQASTELVFSTRDDGYAFTDPKVLTDDGTLWGLYRKYAGSTDLGRFPFAWNTTDGFVDLLDRTANFDDDGWDKDLLTQFLFDATDNGQLTLHGKIDDQSSSWYGPFLLVEAANITGDFNNSSQVEQGDLDLVLQNWGLDTTSAGIPAGWTNDNADLGQIEQTELDRVLQNWGSTNAPDFSPGKLPGLPELPAVPELPGVPEPASFVLLTAATCFLRRR